MPCLLTPPTGGLPQPDPASSQKPGLGFTMPAITNFLNRYFNKEQRKFCRNLIVRASSNATDRPGHGSQAAANQHRQRSRASRELIHIYLLKPNSTRRQSRSSKPWGRWMLAARALPMLCGLGGEEQKKNQTPKISILFANRRPSLPPNPRLFIHSSMSCHSTYPRPRARPGRSREMRRR